MLVDSFVRLNIYIYIYIYIYIIYILKRHYKEEIEKSILHKGMMDDGKNI